MILVLLLLFAVIGSVVFLALLLVDDFLQKVLPRFAGTHVVVGDRVVYRKQKVSTHPCPRAYDIHPAGQGDTYSYFVDKFWVVEDVLQDGRILVTTRTGKHHYLLPDDPRLSRAGWMARIRHRGRFPQLLEAA